MEQKKGGICTNISGIFISNKEIPEHAHLSFVQISFRIRKGDVFMDTPIIYRNRWCRTFSKNEHYCRALLSFNSSCGLDVYPYKTHICI